VKPNIALLCTFSFDDYCWFVTPVEGVPHQKKILARWLGVAHEVGGPMSYWGLPGTYKVVARSTVLPLTANELKDPLIIADMLTIGKDRTDKEIEADLGILFPADGDLLDLDEDDGFEAYEPEAAMPELTTGRPRPSISTSLLRFSCRPTASFFEDARLGGSVAPTGIQSGRRIPTRSSIRVSTRSRCRMDRLKRSLRTSLSSCFTRRSTLKGMSMCC
jgi:hypothetical protein